MGDPRSDDWLPDGWRVEVKIRKNGKKDKCYFPPSGGGKFCSKLEVFRFLSNNRPQSAENEKGIDQQSSENSPATAKKLKLAASGITEIVSHQKSMDEQILNSPSMEECIPSSQCTSDQSRVHAELNSSELPEEKPTNLNVMEIDSVKSVFVVASANGIDPDNHSVESEVTRIEIKRNGNGKSKKNEDIHIPRRASKRLAGIPLDPTPELKTTNRARRASVRKSSKMVAGAGEGSFSDKLEAKVELNPQIDTPKVMNMLLGSTESKHPIRNVTTPNEHALEEEKEKKGDDKHECDVISPPQTIVDKYDGKTETKNNADEKPGLPLDLPLGELWQDPCIAFAIKTLTGISFEDSDSMKVSSGSNNNENIGGLAIAEENAGKEYPGNGSAIAEDQTGEVETNDNSDGKPEFVLDSSFTDAWADPCIEFAIKTLTGAIPLDCNMVIQDYLPQQISSSQQQESSHFALPKVGEFCQTEVLCEQFGTSEKTLFNQASLVQPAFTHSKNVNLGYSGETSQPGHGNERSRKSQW